MKFNNIDFKNLLIVETIERNLMPTIKNEAIQIAGRAGSYLTETNIGNTYINVKCRLIETSRIEVQKVIRNIAGKLYTTQPAKLELRDEPDKYNIAKVTGTSSVEKFLYTGYFEIEFEAHDPFAYGVEVTAATNANFTNTGTYAANGIITFKAGTGNELTVSNGTQTLKMIYPFTGTQNIVINLENQSVTMNGTNAMKYLSLDSDFFQIPIGTAKITIVPAPTGAGTVKYKPRWL